MIQNNDNCIGYAVFLGEMEYAYAQDDLTLLSFSENHTHYGTSASYENVLDMILRFKNSESNIRQFWNYAFIVKMNEGRIHSEIDQVFILDKKNSEYRYLTENDIQDYATRKCIQPIRKFKFIW